MKALVFGATALALRKFYGLDDETIEYFLEHVRADLGHTDSSGNLIEDYIGSGKDVARARRASAVTLWAWCEMHEAILRELARLRERVANTRRCTRADWMPASVSAGARTPARGSVGLPQSLP